jgi:hypothetical protein
MKNRHNINELRAATPDELIEKYGNGSHFDEDGVPVVIAARDEPNENVATLLASLAQNNQKNPDVLVRPIVVENGSTSENRAKTIEIVQAMGATILHSDEPYKLAALKTAVAKLHQEERLDKPVLFTDADSAVSSNWVNALSSATAGDTLAFASGRSTLDHGPSAISDAVGILALRFEDIARRVGKKPPVGRGDNTALNFANDEATIDWYLGQDSNLFVFEDDAITQEFVARGARFVRLLGRDAAVVSSLGDRFPRVWDRIDVIRPGGLDRLFEKYEYEYPGIKSGKRPPAKK